jgi:hypothetical protein
VRIIPLRDHGKIRWPIPDTPHDEVIATYKPPHVDTSKYAERLVEGQIIIEVGWAQLELGLEEAGELGGHLCELVGGETPRDPNTPPFYDGGAPEGGNT